MRIQESATPTMQRLSRCLNISVVFILSVGLSATLAQAPSTITPDGTLGTTVTQIGATHTIAGGALRGCIRFPNALFCPAPPPLSPWPPFGELRGANQREDAGRMAPGGAPGSRLPCRALSASHTIPAKRSGRWGGWP